jgi:hypothetical protein
MLYPLSYEGEGRGRMPVTNMVTNRAVGRPARVLRANPGTRSDESRHRQSSQLTGSPPASTRDEIAEAP